MQMARRSRPKTARTNPRKPARPAKPANAPPRPAQPLELTRGDARSDAEPEHSANRFPIVGIGASAGGLETFSNVLRALPPDTHMAFVLVQHLAPQHESM